jgi:signal transduction histidine kinase
MFDWLGNPSLAVDTINGAVAPVLVFFFVLWSLEVIFEISKALWNRHRSKDPAADHLPSIDENLDRIRELTEEMSDLARTQERGDVDGEVDRLDDEASEDLERIGRRNDDW